MHTTTMICQVAVLTSTTLVLALADAAGSTITLSDGTFAPADWNTVLVFDNGAGASWSGFQDTSTGLPAPSLGGTLVSDATHSGFENMALVQQYVPSVLNPIQVALPQVIESVSMAFDFELLPNSVYPPAQIQLQSVVAQNGKYYFGPMPFSGDHIFVSQGWVNVTMPNVHANDFTEVSPAAGLVAGSHPSFLAPFSVGVGVLRSTQFHNLPGEWRIDNWTAQAAVVPEPSTLVLAALGGLAVFAYRGSTMAISD